MFIRWFIRWMSYSIVVSLLVLQASAKRTSAKRRNFSPRNMLWNKSSRIDFKRNCSLQRSALVSNILSQTLYPIYEKYQLKIPRRCIFLQERNIYRGVEMGKTELSGGHVKCEFCGKLFENENYFYKHMDRKHANVYVFNKDFVCLSDYCDIFRCDLHEMYPVNPLDFDLCNKKDVRKLQRKCEKIVYTCLPTEMQHYVYDSLTKSLCAPLNCNNFYADFEDVSIWYIAFMLMLIPATFILFLFVLWCCNELSNDYSEGNMLYDKYEKEKFETMILKGRTDYYISHNQVRRR
ncbi:uncharacterized protein LOC105846648 isoform X2 [Hydra vulgaris]|uniref:Uncharacterized protein LOC105846648 isoform X2 n=1 Tax=Hydra vulgaris TaxID=6087 RepID=A0ABM4DKJ1_HYDVU